MATQKHKELHLNFPGALLLLPPRPSPPVLPSWIRLSSFEDSSTHGAQVRIGVRGPQRPAVPVSWSLGGFAMSIDSGFEINADVLSDSHRWDAEA